MRRNLGLPAFVLALGSLAACATATNPGNGDDVGPDADTTRPDADPAAPDAADTPDAAVTPQAVTLTQSTATTVVLGNTLVCSNNVNDIPTFTLENHFYRTFLLTAHGITGTFTATRVDFAIEEAETVAGSQTLTVRLHRLTGALTNANLTLLYGQPVTINDGATTASVTLTAPVVVPAGSTLVLEILAPAHTVANNFFYMGSNGSGQSGPSYIAAPGCGITEPANYTTVEAPATPVHLVMSVSGTKP